MQLFMVSKVDVTRDGFETKGPCEVAGGDSLIIQKDGNGLFTT